MLYSMCLVLQLFKINITNNPCTETDQPKFAHLKKKKKVSKHATFQRLFFRAFINWTRVLAAGKQQHLTLTCCVYKP